MNTPTTPQNPDVPNVPDAPEPTGSTAAPEPTEATLADDVFDDTDRTEAFPTEAIPTGSAAPAAPATSWSTPAAAPAAIGTGTATATAPAPTPVPAPAPAEPEYLRGPAPFALVLGLLGLVVAGSVLVGELTDVSLPWNDLGPWTVVAAGLLVLLVGAIGLRSSRARD